MFKKIRMLFLYAETPFHPGSGTNIVGADQPIQRERHTQFPINQAGGLKGGLRALTEQFFKINEKKKEKLSNYIGKKDGELNGLSDVEKKDLKNLTKIQVMLGPDRGSSSEHGSALAFTEARILLFPVRSLVGLFAWITCPTVIARFKRDLQRLENIPELTWEYFFFADSMHVAVPQESTGEKSTVMTATGQVVLEDFAFEISQKSADKANAAALAKWLSERALPNDTAYGFWKQQLRHSLVVVPDDVFRDFVQLSTEVITRNRIGEKGTVEEGALWSEERLPTDTLMYSLMLVADPRDPELALTTTDVSSAEEITGEMTRILEKVPVVQLGGNETVGEGLIRITPLGSVAP